MADRTWNLLGATALGIGDLIERAVVETTGLDPAGPPALLHLQREPGCSQRALQQTLGLSQPGASHLIGRLVSAGLVERGVGLDGRTTALRLTGTGKRLASQAQKAREAVLRDVLAGLSGEQRRALEAALQPVLELVTATGNPVMRTCRLCDIARCEADGACPATFGRGVVA